MTRFRIRWGQPRGVTAVELVIAVSILAIISIVAIPGILGGIQRIGVDGASRRLAEDLRLAQSTALTRGAQARLVVFDQTGTAPNPGSTALSDTTRANQYRLELRAGPAAAWPALRDTAGTNSNVLTAWSDLGSQYRGVGVTTGNIVLFNSQGFLANSASALAIVLQGSAGTRTIQTSPIGKVTIQ